jgi:hypothetical protein
LSVSADDFIRWCCLTITDQTPYGYAERKRLYARGLRPFLKEAAKCHPVPFKIMHSCFPNVAVQVWRVQSRLVPALFATRNLKDGECLSLNFNEEFNPGVCACQRPDPMCSKRRKRLPIQYQRDVSPVSCSSCSEFPWVPVSLPQIPPSILLRWVAFFPPSLFPPFFFHPLPSLSPQFGQCASVLIAVEPDRWFL